MGQMIDHLRLLVKGIVSTVGRRRRIRIRIIYFGMPSTGTLLLSITVLLIFNLSDTIPGECFMTDAAEEWSFTYPEQLETTDIEYYKETDELIVGFARGGRVF